MTETLRGRVDGPAIVARYRFAAPDAFEVEVNDRHELVVGERRFRRQPGSAPWEEGTWPERVAYSVDHLGPQVVITQGLLDTLTPQQVDAVVAHEHAHLRLGHPRLLLAAAAARLGLRWWLPARRSHAALRVAVERWADDEAAAEPARRQHLRAALVTLAAVDLGGAAAAFSLADATLERIEAMDQPPRAPLGLHALLYAPGLAGGVVAVVSTGSWASQARLVLAMAGRCTI